MEFFDLHVHSAFSGGKSSVEELANMAKLLGYKGICFSEYFQGKSRIKELEEIISRVSEKVGINIFLGFEARNAHELAKLIKLRRRFDVLLARGGDLKMNRLAVETREVDILTHPEFERTDSGLNHIMAKLASKNNVAIEINFREILTTDGWKRGRVFHSMRQNIILAKKFKAPIILCSGAVSHFELRDPYCIISMAYQLGLSLEEAKKAITQIPKNILLQAKERRSKNWIRPGVKVVK